MEENTWEAEYAIACNFELELREEDLKHKNECDAYFTNGISSEKVNVRVYPYEDGKIVLKVRRPK